MSEPETEATATPDDGDFDVDEVDQEDLQAYLADRDNWKKQQNRTNMKAAEKEKEYTEKLEKLLDQAVTRGTAPTPQQQQHGPMYSVQQFARDFGVKDWNEEITAEQFYRGLEGFLQFGKISFAKVVGDVEVDASGQPAITLKDAYDVAKDTQAKLDALASELESHYAANWAAEIQKEYEFADPGDIQAAITKHAGDADYEEKVMEAAQRSHDKVAKHLPEAEARGKAKKTRMPRHTGAKRGGKAVTGERPPNPWSPEGRRRMHESGALSVPGE